MVEKCKFCESEDQTKQHKCYTIFDNGDMIFGVRYVCPECDFKPLNEPQTFQIHLLIHMLSKLDEIKWRIINEDSNS